MAKQLTYSVDARRRLARTTLGASRVTLGPRGRNVSAKRTHTLSGTCFGDDGTPEVEAPPPAIDSAILESLNKRTDEILKRLDEDEKHKRIALIIGAASALFAAVKLGFVAFPILRSRRSTT